MSSVDQDRGVPAATRFNGAALGARIKLLRDLRDLSLQQVADAAGLTKSHVWELEQGRSINPTVNAVWGLSTALCVSPAMLLGLDDRMPPIEPVALKIAGIVDREIKAAVKAHVISLAGPNPPSEPIRANEDGSIYEPDAQDA